MSKKTSETDNCLNCMALRSVPRFEQKFPGRTVNKAHNPLESNGIVPSTIRINLFLARAGVASRRGADRLIESGQVRVNGAIVTILGTPIDPARDRVEVAGRLIGHRNPSITW
jgi:ribosomal protein S4